MGVRFASSRRLDVVVMAPALTEAGQSQNFKLPHATHPTPAAPLGVLNGLNKYSVSKILKHGLISKVSQTVNRFSESGKCDSQCLNGIGNKVAEESDSISLDRLATLAIASELLKVGKSPYSATIRPGALRRTSVQGGDTIMNNCDQYMEEHDINMGIQSTAPVPSVDGSSLKEKTVTNDMDQLFNNFGGISTDMGNSGDLGHVDDILQVITSMESRTAESDPTAFRHMEGSETDEMFPMPDGADLAGGLSSFERVLFNDEEEIDLCGGVPLVDTISLAEQDKEVARKERIAECLKVQFELERKCDWLVRRLRKLQSRSMGKHIGEELQGLLQYKHRVIEAKRKAMSTNSDMPGHGIDVASTSSVDMDVQTSHNEHKYKAVPESEISMMIQRLDMVSQQQAAVAARQRSSKTCQSDRIPEVIPRLDSSVRQELDQVSSQLHTQLKMVETALDSDATASSSGGESCDEMQSFNNQHQLHLTISKRAAWKWARDRAAIAGRWTWLQAQISDLEYRIRQHNELHKTLRLSKGAVILGEHPTPMSPAPAAEILPAASRNHTMVVNGFHGTLPGATASSKPRSDVLNGTVLPAPPTSPPSCSRVRPLNRALFRKRKLLQGVGLHTTSKKAARPATMRCRCVFREKLENPCLLCTGRFDPTYTLPTDVMPVTERMSVLDPTLHPVLSLQDEVRESLHYASQMQAIDYQQKVLRTQKVAKPATERQDDHTTQERRNFKIDQQRKFKTRLKKNIINNNLSSKIRRTLVKTGRKPKSYYEQNNHSIQRLSSKSSGSTGVRGVAFNEHRYSADYPEENAASRGSRHPSPEPSGPMERYAKERRKRENSYDIDNIIIPRSYSSAARVEIITYKEIPTPKWRLMDESDLDFDTPKEKCAAGRATGDSDVEDYSDEAIALRHEKCLADEKKKFSTVIKLPQLMRGRGQRRTDSLAESSGANTPDPMSPANMLEQGRESCTGSPMASPPATPQPSSATDTDGNLTQAQVLLGRRRTVSQSRWPREREELFRTSPDITLEVSPFEQRMFPIPDEVMDKILKSRPEEQITQPQVEPPKKFTPKLQSVMEVAEPMSEIRPVSPASDSSESVLGEGDDPNDPEWTVGEERDSDKERLIKR